MVSIVKQQLGNRGVRNGNVAFSIGFMHSLAGLVPGSGAAKSAQDDTRHWGRVGLQGAPGASRGELVDALLVLIPLEKRIPGMVSGSPPEKTARRNGKVAFSLGETHKQRLRKNQ